MAPTRTAQLDPQRDFEALRAAARRRFLARARRAGQHAYFDLDEAADDAYQEAWLELVRRPAPAVGDPAGYLAGIMWHRFHRRELRPARAPSAPLDDGLASREPGPEEVTAGRDALRAVHEALSELPERERAAVLLRSLGLGVDDVAASLGVSPRRARKLSDAGHRRLAAALEAASAGERCAAVASTLQALSLGWEIAGLRRTRLERHLAGCLACRATVAALRREGHLAVVPIALADVPADGARGLAEHAVQAVTRLWERAPAGGAEASAGLLGGALATKIVAGCVAVGLGVGCVAVVARDEPDRSARPAAAPARPPSAGAAAPILPAGPARSSELRTQASNAARRAGRERARRAAARTRRRVRDARQNIERAQQRTQEAQQRTQEAQQQTEQAQQRTQEAQRQTEQAQQKIADAQAKIEQATGALENALGGVP